VVSPKEYYGKVPKDPAHAQIVPVPPRPFPSNLRDPDLLPDPPRRSDLPLAVWAGLAFALLTFVVLRLVHRFFPG
jgi:hypothetical protein